MPPIPISQNPLSRFVDRLHAPVSIQSLALLRIGFGLLLAWDERHALLTLVITAFGRAISEVGTVMIVGGNIDYVTRVMTTAIALETSKGDLPLALALGFILISIVLILNALAHAVREWAVRRHG